MTARKGGFQHLLVAVYGKLFNGVVSADCAEQYCRDSELHREVFEVVNIVAELPPPCLTGHANISRKLNSHFEDATRIFRVAIQGQALWPP